jgi:hypothetical protein
LRSNVSLNELLGARLPQTMTGRKSGLGAEALKPGRAPDGLDALPPKPPRMGRNCPRAHAPATVTEAQQRDGSEA